MNHFATLFDRAYLAKGLALHASLERHCSEPWVLYVLAMDDETFRIIEALKLANIRIVRLRIFEIIRDLEELRATRTWQEYNWMMASQFTELNLSGPAITYLDADLFFFGDPKAVFDEIGSRSIGIVPHRFPPSRKHLEVNGRFNVGWVTIRNDEIGRACIARWAAQCREWCYYRNDGGLRTCGDQGYLNEWPELYGDAVAVIENPGAGLAPWNLEAYRVSKGPKVDEQPTVFYHFHGFSGPEKPTDYPLRFEDREYIYEPYLTAWKAANDRIEKAEASILAEMEWERA